MDKSMNAKLYEELIGQIAQSAVETADGVVNLGIGVGGQNKITGVSGFDHQIDVSISNGVNLLLVECKYWGDNIHVGMALTFLGRIIDIRDGVHEKIIPVIATNKGWQAGVEKIAGYYNIDLWLAKSASEFGIRYKNQILLGVNDTVTVSDHPIVKVVTPEDTPISLQEAAELSGLTQPHLAHLIRKGELLGKKIGRNWVTTAQAVNEYLARGIKRGDSCNPNSTHLTNQHPKGICHERSNCWSDNYRNPRQQTDRVPIGAF
jgi:excisionase family DNA binding protein